MKRLRKILLSVAAELEHRKHVQRVEARLAIARIGRNYERFMENPRRFLNRNASEVEDTMEHYNGDVREAADDISDSFKIWDEHGEVPEELLTELRYWH